MLRKYMRRAPLVAVVGLALLGVGATTAEAATLLSLDLNSVQAQATDSAGVLAPFGDVTHTGKVVVSQGSLGFISGIEVDGVGQAGTFTGVLTGLSGEFILNNGAVTGGSFTITIESGGDTDTYSFDLAPDALSLVQSLGVNSYLISSPTSGGTFDDTNFGGVDVSDFSGNTLDGLILQFNFSPDGRGFDGAVDLEIQVKAASGPGPMVPLPASAWMGLALLGGLGAVRYVRGRKTVQA